MNNLTIARTEREWQNALRKKNPQLVIFDDGVSGQDGTLLLSEFRRRFPHALVIYLATRHTPDLERAVRQLGVLYYTEKPPDPVLISRLLTSALAPFLHAERTNFLVCASAAK